MATFEEPFEDTQNLFTKFIDKIDNLREVNIKVLINNRLKEIGKVVKANDLLKHMTGEDIVILLNEAIFEQLEDSQKLMIVESLVARFYFDAEKGKIVFVEPDFNGFSLIITKYGFETCLNTKLLIDALFAQQKDAEGNKK